MNDHMNAALPPGYWLGKAHIPSLVEPPVQPISVPLATEVDHCPPHWWQVIESEGPSRTERCKKCAGERQVSATLDFDVWLTTQRQKALERRGEA